MNSLTPDNNFHNPWFKDYWEDMFNCKVSFTEDDLDKAEATSRRRGHRRGQRRHMERWLGGPGGGRSKWVGQDQGTNQVVTQEPVSEDEDYQFRTQCDKKFR